MSFPAPVSVLRALHSDSPSRAPHEQDPCCSSPDQLPGRGKEEERDERNGRRRGREVGEEREGGRRRKEEGKGRVNRIIVYK